MSRPRTYRTHFDGGATALYIALVPLAALIAFPEVAAIVTGFALQAVPVAADSLARAIRPAPTSVIQPGWLTEMWLFPRLILAGMFGGVLHVVRLAFSERTQRRAKVREAKWWLLLIAASAIAGNYVPALLAWAFGAPQIEMPPVAFLVGFGGMALMDTVLTGGVTALKTAMRAAVRAALRSLDPPEA